MLKPYYEAAIIKSVNGAIKGFLLGHERDLIDNKKKRYNRFEYYDVQKFQELVHGDCVQYFTWDSENNCIAIKYLPEELQDIKDSTGKSGLSLVSKSQTFEDYCKNDMMIYWEYFSAAKEHGGISGALASRMSMPLVGSVYTVYLYGESGIYQKISEWLNSEGDQAKKMIHPIFVQDTNVALSISSLVYYKFAYDLNILMTVNTEDRDTPSGFTSLLYTSRKNRIKARDEIAPVNELVMKNLIA